MKSIHVSLKERSYDIFFGPLSSGLPQKLIQLGLKQRKIFLVTSLAVKKAGHLARLVSSLKKNGYPVSVVVLPNGEPHKNLKALSRLYSEGLKAGLDRKSVVLALGGGVITDLAGFFAASFMRGISLINVPTTLLGMVDASIGGKTGVDLPQGKNLVGAFWQPKLVWIDPSVLKTLPTREFNTGFAEVIKYGVIKDKIFFKWLEQKLKKNSRVEGWPLNDIEHAIFVSAQIKANVVSADERETPLKGGREILNFGHTIGHALEAATSYGSLSHGEAISIGMAFAGQLALRLGMWSEDEQLQLLSLFEAVKLPIHFPNLSKSQWAHFWSALQRDKKHVSGSLRFVLPQKMGTVIVKSGISRDLVKSTVRKTGG